LLEAVAASAHNARMAPRWIIALLLGCVVLLAACAAPVRPLPEALPQAPEEILPVRFPQDDGPHALLTEWWYYTGHLRTDSGQRYGFEYVTFQALRGQNRPAYVSHLAITDHQRKQFRFDQRQQVDAHSGSGEGFNLSVEGWTMRGANGMDMLSAAMDDYAIELSTRSLKPPALHDGDGYITFGPAGGSYYYSRTRLVVSGTLTDGDTQHAVRGEAWFDHQWGNFLMVGAGGWDWYSAQLDDGSELTVSVVRDDQGGVPLAYGTYIDPTGAVLHLPAELFSTEATGSWTSPRSGARYPMGWRLKVEDPALDLTLAPVLEDQELDTGSTTGAIYWEGEVLVSGTAASRPLSGYGYVELTGYAS
jgi:predicted secreted hydrolase